jgi:hypothetical protein
MGRVNCSMANSCYRLRPTRSLTSGFGTRPHSPRFFRYPIHFSFQETPSGVVWTQLDCDFVGIDLRSQCLSGNVPPVGEGMTSVVLLEEDLPVSSVEDRTAGFRRALCERGIKTETVVRVVTRRRESGALPRDPEDAYHLALQLIGEVEPDAPIMVGRHYFALRVYRALLDAGREIPRQMAVMGYGDHPVAAYLQKPLSSAQLPQTKSAPWPSTCCCAE